MTVHALVTGETISGRIPVDGHPDGFVDVTPAVLYFEHDDDAPPDVLWKVAAAIDQEHFIRGSHPIQKACKALDDPEQYPHVSDELRKAHQSEHKALNARLGGK